MEKAVFKLDRKDQRIIAELERDGRQSITRIAKKIGVSKEVAAYRFRRLQESGLIKGFRLLVDYYSLGFQTYRLLINLSNLRESVRKKIISELRSLKNAEISVFLLSRWDIEVQMWIQHPKEFYSFYNSFIAKYSNYVHDRELFVITKEHFTLHGHIHQGSGRIMLGDQKTAKRIDNIDRKMLLLLAENPRKDVVSLAAKSGMPASTLQYRIKNLLAKNIIKGVIPLLDTNLLGYSRYRVEIILNEPAKKNTLVQHFIALPNTIRITELVGSKDISFDADFRTAAELDRFLDDLSVKFPYIKDFEVISVLE